MSTETCTISKNSQVVQFRGEVQGERSLSGGNRLQGQRKVEPPSHYLFRQQKDQGPQTILWAEEHGAGGGGGRQGDSVWEQESGVRANDACVSLALALYQFMSLSPELPSHHLENRRGRYRSASLSHCEG